eukprot:380247_1
MNWNRYQHTTNDCLSKFNSYSLLKQILISSSIITASSVMYTFTSYYICKLRYSKMPKIYHFIQGNINSNKGILIFISGWPDTTEIYNSQVEYFVNKNYCCITLEFPNMNIERIQNPG